MNGGFDALADQVADHIRAEVGSWFAFFETREEMGATPIERLLLASVLMAQKFHPECAESLRSCTQAEHDTLMREGAVPHQILWTSQYQLPDWRVDFLFSVHSYWPRYPIPPKPEGWRSLIVECDGHDFHERTKEQAARDRARDRWAVDNDYEIFRFTGSEIWRRPWECGLQVLRWCEKGW
jgi:hypothetical protein